MAGPALPEADLPEGALVMSRVVCLRAGPAGEPR